MPYFALLLAAVAVAISVATLLVALRLRSMLRGLAEASAAQTERLAGIAARPPPASPELLKENLAALQREVTEGQAALAASIAAIPRPEPPAPPPRIRVAEEVGPLLREAVDVLQSRLTAIESSLHEERTETASERISAILAERGFAQVVFVEGPTREDECLSAVVEARRDGMAFKGPVVIRGRDVVRESLRPAYPMFP